MTTVATLAPANRPMTALEWLTLFVLALLWGGAFFFSQVAVAELPPMTVVAGRVVLAAAAMAVFAALSGAAPPRALWPVFLAMGFLNNALPFSMIVWGQSQIGSGPAAIVNATTPLFTVFVAHFLTADEKLTTRRVAGLALGLGGVATIVGPGALRAGAAPLAEAAILVAALSYAFASVYGRRFRTLGVKPVGAAAGQLLASALLVTPVALMIDRPWTLAAPSDAAIAAVVAGALLSTGLAYVLYFRLLASAGASNVMIVTLLIPAVAAGLGAAFLGETLESRHLAGMALIALGLAATDGRPLAWARRVALTPPP
jgi:drug/metabolite transporter (DMT)-like permease